MAKNLLHIWDDFTGKVYHSIVDLATNGYSPECALEDAIKSGVPNAVKKVLNKEPKPQANKTSDLIRLNLYLWQEQDQEERIQILKYIIGFREELGDPPQDIDCLNSCIEKNNEEAFKILSKEMSSLGLKPKTAAAVEGLKQLIKKQNIQFLRTYKEIWSKIWHKEWDNELLQEAIINSPEKDTNQSLNENIKKLFITKNTDPTNNGANNALKHFESEYQKSNLTDKEYNAITKIIKEILSLYPERDIKEIALSKNWSDPVKQEAKNILNQEFERYGPTMS
jgi:hypothetical protein